MVQLSLLAGFVFGAASFSTQLKGIRQTKSLRLKLFSELYFAKLVETDGPSTEPTPRALRNPVPRQNSVRL
jgi:hypothetical protein